MFKVTELEFEQHLKTHTPEGVTVKSLELDRGRTDTFYSANEEVMGLRFRMGPRLPWVYTIPNKYKGAAANDPRENTHE